MGLRTYDEALQMAESLGFDGIREAELDGVGTVYVMTSTTGAVLGLPRYIKDVGGKLTLSSDEETYKFMDSDFYKNM